VLDSLVDRARQGDEEAFGILVRQVGDRCLAIAYRILRDFDRAEDAVQTTLVAAWRELPNLRDAGRFEAWLHRMLVNACYAEAKRSRRRDASVQMLVADPKAGDDYHTINDRDQLERAFARISPEQRAVVVFHLYLGLTVPEVAEHLGIPLGTAKSRIHAATAALRAVLEADARVPAVRQERPA
jgi:RNA polymerase sigma-70 factor (ECF subfamily)